MHPETESQISVLDEHGFVRLDGAMADDLSVINSARVSFHKRQGSIKDGDDGLINFLMKNRHGTPFEHNAFRFHVAAPIFIFREWQRHRIGSFNEWSARYSQLEPRFYVPRVSGVRSRVGKPGQYNYEPAEENLAKCLVVSLTRGNRDAYGVYEELLKQGVAPEQARLFLPVNIYSEMYWTVNARSMMNFLSLRNAPTAQWEIQQYAKAVEIFFEQLMPVTYASFVKNGRIAP